MKDKTKVKHSGRWTEQEHQKFIQAIKKYGKDWKKIKEEVGTRSAIQVRSHAQKYFQKLNKTDFMSNPKDIDELKNPDIKLKEAEDEFYKALDKLNNAYFKLVRCHMEVASSNLAENSEEMSDDSIPDSQLSERFQVASGNPRQAFKPFMDPEDF